MADDKNSKSEVPENPLFNSAARLHLVLSVLVSQPQEETLRKAWARTFNIPDLDIHGIFENIVKLYKLTEQVESDLASIPGVNLRLYMMGMQPIRDVLSQPNLEGIPLRGILPLLSPSVLGSLEFCSDKLKDYFSERKLSNDEMQNLRELLEALFEEVSKAPLDEVIKITLLQSVEMMRRALREYEIFGAQRIKEEAFGAYAKLAAFAVSCEREERESKWGIIISKFRAFSEFLARVEKNYATLAPLVRGVLS